MFVTALSIQLLLPVFSFPVYNVNCFGTLFKIFRVWVIAWPHQAIFVHRLWLAHQGVLLLLAIAAWLFVSVQWWRLNMVDEWGSSNHVLHTFFLYFLHVSLVLKHFADVLDLKDVTTSSLFEFLVVFYQEFVFFALGVIHWMLLVVELPQVHGLSFFDQVVALNYFLQELFFSLKLIIFKKRATSDLVEAKPLTWKFAQCFIDNLLESRRVRDALENLPKILLHGTWEPFKVWICLNSFSERWRLHLNHEKCCTNWKNVCLLAIVFWIDWQISDLGVNGLVIENSVFIFLFKFTFKLLKVYFVVPYLRSVINFRAYVRPSIYNRIIIFLKYSVSICLLESSCETKICDYNPTLLVD